MPNPNNVEIICPAAAVAVEPLMLSSSSSFAETGSALVGLVQVQKLSKIMAATTEKQKQTLAKLRVPLQNEKQQQLRTDPEKYNSKDQTPKFDRPRTKDFIENSNGRGGGGLAMNPRRSDGQGQESEEAKELKIALQEAFEEAGVTLSPSVIAAALFLLGNATAAPAFRLARWLSSVRGRRETVHVPDKLNAENTMSCDTPQKEESVVVPRHINFKHADIPTDIPNESSLWERLGKAVALDIDSSEFSWDRLISLHHTEHTSSADHSEDEQNRPLEVTVNSGGVVFFVVFEAREENYDFPCEGVAVMKFSSSRMATQSERLGYEFAKRFGVPIPQARVIHNCNPEWQSIKDAAENARARMSAEGDEMGKTTCTELLEALELSRCLLLMGYVHGCPLFDNSSAFNSQEAAEKTASALGRLLILDLVLRNEDRLPCRQLGWRGNPANLLFTDKLSFIPPEASNHDSPEPLPRRNRTSASSQRERRYYSVDSSRSSPDRFSIVSQLSDNSDLLGTISSINLDAEDSGLNDSFNDFCLVAIDSGVPRRPPAGKRNIDQIQYPKLVELILNSAEFSSNLLYELSGERIGSQNSEEATTSNGDSGTPETNIVDHAKVVQKFRSGFRHALREMQSLHVFLLKLHQKLEMLLKSFLQMISKQMPCDSDDKEDSGVYDIGTPHNHHSNWHGQSSSYDREIGAGDSGNSGEGEEVLSEVSSTPRGILGRSSARSYRDCSPDTASPCSKDFLHSKMSKGNTDRFSSKRITMKLKDLSKTAKMDAELSKELESWNESLKVEAIKFCQENAFTTGFFEGSDINTVVDSYELKVRLEHLVDRMTLISQAASTERPSCVTSSLFIGGALAASSVHTLQYLGITNILCMCPNELGQSDSQFTDFFEYKNLPIYDTDDANISSLFEEAFDYIDSVEKEGGKILVHCFEGKSRSATVILAYLMLRKNHTLLEAWKHLKRVHRRAQPNDGFMRTLMDLDKRLYGKHSMDWQQRKPVVRICPVCVKKVGVSSSSLRLHLQRAHPRISSGSVDSNDIKEIKQAVELLKRNQH